VASLDGSFGVVWEETDESHRGIHFQALDSEARPLSASVEVADLARGGAQPKVIADGDGYAVLWTVDQAETSVIAFRRVDARGQPRGDLVPSVSAPSVRALAVARSGGRFGVVWWSWALNPPLQALSWLDAGGKPVGKPLELSTGPLVDPAADLLSDGTGGLSAAWEEQIEGAAHVVVGHAAEGALAQRLVVGPGNAPSLTQIGVMFAHLDDASIWWSPLAEARPARFTDGQYPDGAPLGPERAVLCVVRSAPGDESPVDELDCLELQRGEPVRDDKIASAPRGLVAQQVAPTPGGYGVVFQTEEPDAMAVHLATVKCPPPR
jgi:hypothetical protein